ncbi:MAG: hypothetical protein LBU37_03010 [Tannerellaceae bacterium]|jgi:hypothetical protein|nr:hypothetical protein [Tannerellaceae bacterium]
MKKFILKLLLFVSLLILLFGLFLLFLFLPSTPRASKSLLFAEIKKDSLLIATPSTRIVFVGGSNLSFGVNCQLIKDSLKINPINTAIHAGIGIKYMLEKTLKYIKKGDIIVFVPEYEHFYSDWNIGSPELLRTVIEVNNRSNVNLLSKKQLYNCFSYIGIFILSKFNPFEYINIEENDVYGVNSFNEYGDVDAHWNLENRHDEITSNTIDITGYNPEVIVEIRQIMDKLQEKGCIFLVSYPCFQETSFNNSIEAIKKVEEDLKNNTFKILGTPERYMMSDSLMFDTVYHLNKQGLERRTKLLIEDLKTVLHGIN